MNKTKLLKSNNKLKIRLHIGYTFKKYHFFRTFKISLKVPDLGGG